MILHFFRLVMYVSKDSGGHEILDAVRLLESKQQPASFSKKKENPSDIAISLIKH